MSKKPSTMYEIGSPLEDFKVIVNNNWGLKFTTNIVEQRQKYNVEQALQKLESIENTKPSEALKELNIIRHLEIGFDKDGNPLNVGMCKGFDIIIQALIKAQKQEKENDKLNGQMKYLTEVITEFQEILSIIKNKGLDYHSLSAIKQAKDFEEFKELTKNLITKFLDYTKEEFELLKRWLNGNNN